MELVRNFVGRSKLEIGKTFYSPWRKIYTIHDRKEIRLIKYGCSKVVYVRS